MLAASLIKKCEFQINKETSALLSPQCMCVVAGTYTKVVTYKIGKSKTKSDGTHLSSSTQEVGAGGL